jgi:iron(III) transport system ATP-binding protein
MLVLNQVARQLGQVAALDGVSLSVGEAQIVCLVGHSGCGKSTLLRVVAGVEKIDSGSLTLAGRVVADGATFVEPEDRNVGFMFQDYALFPHLTARQNIGFGLRAMDKQRRNVRVAEVLERLGIGPLADRYPHQLSGGEQQRIALARALAPQPSVLLMDEPFSNLDPGLRESIRRETVALIRSLGMTAIIVTHDPEEALSTGDWLALMRKGRIVESGVGEKIYARPLTSYAASFFSHVNRVPARPIGDRVESALGVFPAAATGGQLELLIRPHSLYLDSAGIPATVLERSFLGEMEELSLKVEGVATPLVLRSSLRSGAMPGQVVGLAVKRDDVMVFPAEPTRPQNQ